MKNEQKSKSKRKSKFNPASITEFFPQEIEIVKEIKLVKGVRFQTKKKSYGLVIPVPDERSITAPHLKNLYELIDTDEHNRIPYHFGIHKLALHIKDHYEKEGITLPDIKGEGYTYTRSWIIEAQGVISRHKTEIEKPAIQPEPPNLMVINIIPQHFEVTTRTLYRNTGKGKRFKSYPDPTGKIRLDTVRVAQHYPRKETS